jgi:hypothetical protein
VVGEQSQGVKSHPQGSRLWKRICCKVCTDKDFDYLSKRVFRGTREGRRSKAQEGERWKFFKERSPRVFTKISGRDSFQRETNDSRPSDMGVLMEGSCKVF